jgi:GNAT superfamily N-acetyltransferase
MLPHDEIVQARPEHLEALREIEFVAAAQLSDHAPASVLERPTPHDVLRGAQRGGRLWVALVETVVVGFVHVRLLQDGRPHLEDMNVRPDHGRRGLGRALLRAAIEWADHHGHAELTLTTFREVPWNMPFYLQHGFEELAEPALTDELRAIVAEEASRGLDPRTRVVMRRCRP